MEKQIKKVGVIGAGVMGSGIAAHFANAGIKVVLLDIVPPNLSEEEKQDKKARNAFALRGIQNALKFKPAPLFYHPNFANLVTPGNTEDDMEMLEECDWIIEVVPERLDIKQKVLKNIEEHMKWGAFVTSNTSGLSIKAMTEGMSDEFKQNFFVTHFFNPVRFMKLLEIIPGEETDPELVEFVAKFGENVLGKGIVYGKDTPNFVANRIGVYSMMKVMQLMVELDFTVEEIDAIFGKALGRPRSAAFGTADLVGLDTLAHVSQNCYDNLPDDDERDVFKIPDFIQKMIENGLLGRKAKAGFFKKEGKQKFVIDYKTLEYKPVEKPKFEGVKNTKGVDDPADRIVNLLNTEDRAAEIAWKATAATLIYSAKRLGEIADDIVNIDNAMKWGFNWELGPFETWDAIGVKDSVERMEKEGMKVPAFVKDVWEKGEGTFYKKEGRTRYYFDFNAGEYKPVDMPETTIILDDLKNEGKVIKENYGASLIDIGDGVALLEFHTKMNAIDNDVIQMIFDSVDEVEENYEALVVGGHAQNFSVGANLALILMGAEMGNWDMLADVVKQFQDANMRMKYASKPVVAAPFGMTLGGGTEVCLHSDRVQASAELYMGLVEVGVGVIPAGGGTTQTLVRALAGVPADMVTSRFPFIMRAFMGIGMAKVSRSADEAKDLMYLRDVDGVTLNRDKLIWDAKQVALGLAKTGYRPPVPPQNLKLPGRDGYGTLVTGLQDMAWGKKITEYDFVVGKKLGYVLCGGDIRPNSIVTEQHLLDLEKEVFLSLCGEERTRARMKHMLEKGKPLRN